MRSIPDISFYLSPLLRWRTASRTLGGGIAIRTRTLGGAGCARGSRRRLGLRIRLEVARLAPDNRLTLLFFFDDLFFFLGRRCRRIEFGAKEDSETGFAVRFRA